MTAPRRAPRPAPADDQELVGRIRAGDRDAFQMLFDRYASALVAFARTQVDSMPAAEDIVQEVFFAVWMGRERWIVQRSVRAYLCQAVHNRALNYHRNSREDRRRVTSIDETPAVEQCVARERADAPLTDSELRIAIDRAVATLPERNRQVFHLVRQQQLSYPEVATVLGISVKSVEAHMQRAARTLRDILAAWRP